jgi:hypothetical protein
MQNNASFSILLSDDKKNSVAFGPQANYNDREADACRRS